MSSQLTLANSKTTAQKPTVVARPRPADRAPDAPRCTSLEAKRRPVASGAVRQCLQWRLAIQPERALSLSAPTGLMQRRPSDGACAAALRSGQHAWWHARAGAWQLCSREGGQRPVEHGQHGARLPVTATVRPARPKAMVNTNPRPGLYWPMLKPSRLSTCTNVEACRGWRLASCSRRLTSPIMGAGRHREDTHAAQTTHKYRVTR